MDRTCFRRFYRLQVRRSCSPTGASCVDAGSVRRRSLVGRLAPCADAPSSRRDDLRLPPSRRVPAPVHRAAGGLVRLHSWPPAGLHRCEARPGGLGLPPRHVAGTSGRAAARASRHRARRGGGAGSRAEPGAWGGAHHPLHTVDVGPSRRWRLVPADGRAAVAAPDQCRRPWDGACPRGDRRGAGPRLGLQLARPTGHGRGW